MEAERPPTAEEHDAAYYAMVSAVAKRCGPGKVGTKPIDGNPKLT
jgi:hypothetical protein